MHGGYITCAKTAEVSRGTSHITTETLLSLWWIFRTRCVKLVSQSDSYTRAQWGLLGSREQRYSDCEALRAHLECSLKKKSKKKSENPIMDWQHADMFKVVREKTNLKNLKNRCLVSEVGSCS